jgi:hypothetical protein
MNAKREVPAGACVQVSDPMIFNFAQELREAQAYDRLKACGPQEALEPHQANLSARHISERGRPNTRLVVPSWPPQRTQAFAVTGSHNSRLADKLHAKDQVKLREAAPRHAQAPSPVRRTPKAKDFEFLDQIVQQADARRRARNATFHPALDGA